jgi:hypothetical protein
MKYPGVLGTHDLLIHDYGPGRRFASVHVEMAAEGDALGCHDTITQMEQDFLRDGLHMVVHYDPIITEPGKTDDLRQWLAELVKGVHPKLTIHDLRVVPGKTRTKLVFDCLASPKIMMNDKEIRDAINKAVKDGRPDYECVITIDHSFAAIPKENTL